MSEIIEDFEEEKPDSYECGQCGAYWFENPPTTCPFCGNDLITEVWSEELYHP